MTDGRVYKGVALSALRIDEVTWSDAAADHVRSRSQRQPGVPGLEPEWCTEAVLDPNRLVRLAGADKPDSASLKVVGWSPSAFGKGELLKVWVWSDDPHETCWRGASGVIANDSDMRMYRRRGET
jgi:hypothetical protein